MAAALALLSSLAWGSADFIAGNLTKKRAALAVAGAAQVIGLLVMLVVATATASWGTPVWEYLPWAVLASLAGLLGLVSFYQALATGSMSVVSPITALGVVVPLGFGLLQGDQPSPWQYLGILIAIVGVLLAATPEVSGRVGLRPLLLAIVAAVMFGLFLALVALGSETSAVMTMTAQRTTSTLIVVAIALSLRSLGGLQRGDGPALVAIGVFDVGANLLFGIASTLGLLALVAVLGSLYPVVTVVLAWLILKERLTSAQYAGVALALVGVVAISAG
ncbi:DMT family transporter [Candidatus Nanopelagicales bacterium]|nr:DMT family transporter [Candidatus Nanopelagicales bacterium]